MKYNEFKKNNRNDNVFSPDKVFSSIINTEMNKEFLSKIPHRSLFDLSIIYRVDLGEESYKLTAKTHMLACGMKAVFF